MNVSLSYIPNHHHSALPFPFQPALQLFYTIHACCTALSLPPRLAMQHAAKHAHAALKLPPTAALPHPTQHSGCLPRPTFCIWRYVCGSFPTLPRLTVPSMTSTLPSPTLYKFSPKLVQALLMLVILYSGATILCSSVSVLCFGILHKTKGLDKTDRHFFETGTSDVWLCMAWHRQGGQGQDGFVDRQGRRGKEQPGIIYCVT